MVSGQLHIALNSDCKYNCLIGLKETGAPETLQDKP